MTSFWPGPGWLDCNGRDNGDGRITCAIQTVGEGMHEIVVPAESFDLERGRLKVRIVRPSEAPIDPDIYCPSQETDASAFTVDCPGVDGETRTRFDILAGFLNPRRDEAEGVLIP